ncbi:MAG: asparagine synthase-related protein, partial [Myxococcota bacterium]
VALAGDGGEELFGGRMLDGLARSLAAARWFTRLPAPVRSALTRSWPRSDRLRRWSVPAEAYVVQLGIGGADVFTADERASLLRDPALVRPELRREVLAPFYEGLDTDPVNLALHGFLRSSLTEIGLTRADRMASVSGLDVRFPLLDLAVVEAAAALPGSAKLRRTGGSLHTRWPLRGLLRGELPEVLVDRPKRGIPTLVGGWLSGPGRLFLEERCTRLKQDPYGLWRPEAIDALRRDVDRSNAAANRLWSLFVLDSWLRDH